MVHLIKKSLCYIEDNINKMCLKLEVNRLNSFPDIRSTGVKKSSLEKNAKEK